jgi:hypothetical protein
MIALVFALWMAITPSTYWAIEDALDEECFNIQDSIGADWCIYQFTDVQEQGLNAHARVQFSTACDNAPIEQVQEAEFLVTVNLRRASVSQAVWIPSDHLPNGVRDFSQVFCAGPMI